MKRWILNRTQHAYSPVQRLIALILAASLFLVGFPLLLIKAGPALDRWLGLSPLLFQPFNWILGILLIIIGWPLALWTVIVQFTLGNGTPIPVMATQRLIIRPPYTLCRNPMVLGTYLAYLGISVLVGSIGALILVSVFIILLSIYIRQVEEPELLERFGAEYAAYRSRTALLFPRLSKQKHSTEEHS